MEGVWLQSGAPGSGGAFGVDLLRFLHICALRCGRRSGAKRRLEESKDRALGRGCWEDNSPPIAHAQARHFCRLPYACHRLQATQSPALASRTKPRLMPTLPPSSEALLAIYIDIWPCLLRSGRCRGCCCWTWRVPQSHEVPTSRQAFQRNK